MNQVIIFFLLIVILINSFMVYTSNNNNFFIKKKQDYETKYFSPCDNFFMTTVSNNNIKLISSWYGIYLLTNVPDNTNIVISLTFTDPAKVEIDIEKGRVIGHHKQYNITYTQKPPEISEVAFRVRGTTQLFPYIEKIRLNGEIVCSHPQQWNLWSQNIQQSTLEETRKRGNNCGRRIIARQSLIVNGFPSDPGDWPWHAAIYFKKNLTNLMYKCGGTLIAQNSVVTAAMCVHYQGIVLEASKIAVHLGQHNLYTPDIYTQKHEVFEVIVHPGHNITTLSNDIALLKLATFVKYTDYVQRVCLWHSKISDLSNVIGKSGAVVGWGLTEIDELSNLLSQASMIIASRGDCLRSNWKFFGLFLSDKNFCAGYKNGTSVCYGDVGGGIFIENNGQYSIRGIFSTNVVALKNGKRTCNTREYAIFTDIAPFLDWIHKTIKAEHDIDTELE